MVKPERKYTESFALRAAGVDKHFRESAMSDDLPLVIFSEIRAITADKVTRNFTCYPTNELIGNPSIGTGAQSFVYPYPVPILRDHAASPSFLTGLASDCYGRIYNASFVSEASSNGWVRAVAAITDPWAVSMVLSGRWLTTSIGVTVDGIYCSICQKGGLNINMLEQGCCEHQRGEAYDGELCYWSMAGIRADELSFVNVPADQSSRVLTPSLDEYEARSYMTGTDGEYLLDMATGSSQKAESARLGELGISKATYETIIKGAREARESRPKIRFYPKERRVLAAIGAIAKGS